MATLLGEFHNIVRKFPERTAVVHCLSGGRTARTSFAELDGRSEEVAAYLAEHGIASGTLVGICMRRSIDHVAAILGILKTGAAFYSLNPRSTWEQVVHTASLSRAPTVLVDNEALLSLRNIRTDARASFSLTLLSREAPTSIHQQCIDHVRETFELHELPVSPPMQPQAAASRVVVGHDVALALFTSGSTGASKGVLISHQDLFNRVVTECEYFGITCEDALLNLLPFSFDVGNNQLFSALSTGAQLVILNSWLPADIASIIREHHITGISAVPAIWASILNLQGNEDVVRSINTVRYITISGGDLAPAQLERLGEVLQGIRIFKTYGQSETFRSGLLLPSEYKQKMLSVGRPVKGTKVLILNRKGQQALPNEAGEILHLGDGMMLGYLGDAKGTRRKLRANPLQEGRGGPCGQTAVFTGDIGKLDEDGYLYVLGRKDKMIKSSGYRIYPKEISDQIVRHAVVQDAAVFGIPARNSGQAICAEVQLKPGGELTEEELRRFLSDKLPAYMAPARIVFVSSFPRTPSGKIRLAEVEAKLP